MAIYDAPIHDLDGADADLHDYEGKALLLVNVASACGLTPQYAGLQKLHEEFGGKGFEVLGFPCNQFMGQEPGTPDEIKTFCETNYNVTFPLFEKIEVNGDGRHAALRAARRSPRLGRRPHRRHPLELREVPGQPERRDRRPIQPDGRARGRVDRRRHQGPAPPTSCRLESPDRRGRE